MMKWQAKLTKKELKHIKETTNDCTLREFKSNLKWQRELDAKHPDAPFTCVECNHIANKLGI